MMTLMSHDMANRMAEVGDTQEVEQWKHASECFQMFATHTSFMFSCLNNKQTKIQFSIFTSGTIPLPFYLSKYIIYIILEYIKYRMGTIPFHTSRVLCKYSNNCSKTQFVFQWFLYF